MNDIPPALLGLLQQAVDEQPWTCERRDRWLAAFCPVLDFSFEPSDFEVVDGADDESGERLALLAGDEVSGHDDDESDEATDTDADTNDVSSRPAKYIRWRTIIPQLVSGELDKFELRKKTTGSGLFKSELYRRWPGINVDLHDDGDGWTTITVTAGAYS